MDDFNGYYLLAAGIMAGTVFAYWAMPQRRSSVVNQPRSLLGLLLLIGAGVTLCLWSMTLEHPAYTFERHSSPVSIAIAFDLSPSMLAIPNPEIDDELPPRYERGKNVLLHFIRRLEEQGQSVIVSVVGFTKDANIIMGWDQSTAQVRDILEYAVSPDLFGSSGTSIESAAKSLNSVFAMLPETFRTNSRRLAIIVSDGEDTMRASSFDYAIDTINASGFDTIALQTGLVNQNEGVPTYDRMGEFTGFRKMSGEMYTVPDFAAMRAIAEASGGRGLHVLAESQTAAERMLRFTAQGNAGTAMSNTELRSTFGMFAVVSLLCAMILR